MTAGLEVKPVTTASERKAFLRLPHAVFASDPAWIAPLAFERAQHISPKHNPFFQHATAQLFVAWQGDNPVGRISAQVDDLRNQRHRDATGMFGFLDAIDDARVFESLLRTAEGWLASQGMKRAIGPFSFSINEETGLLVDGFEHPPAVMMGHALPYYAAHVEAAGYAGIKDVLAYSFDNSQELPRGLAGMLRKVEATGELKVRPLSKKNLKRDLAILIDIFNDAWSDNWGFTPFSQAEIDKLGADLKMLVSEGFISFAEYQGEPAAMAVTLPDINQAARDLNGSLFPFGVFKLLARLKLSAPEAVRMPLMGVRRKYHGHPVGSALAIAVIDAIRQYHVARGTTRAELSWILEDNLAMRRMIEAVGGVEYKRYRIYERSLDGAGSAGSMP
jgi:GNAT superfamily N-acetyltransferase